jgi:glycosyltransferase involved in cell wall biosynthesis
VKKWIYSLIVERPRFRASAAVSVMLPGEVAEVRAFVPACPGVIRVIPNPVDTSTLGSCQWHYRPDGRRVVFLGRFDVHGKGLDLLWEIARLLPTIEFDLYGLMHRRSERCFARLLNQRLPNVHIHSPVFGAEKARVLAEAALYLQTSRHETSPLSVLEAMLVGVPVALVDRLMISQQFIEHNLGLTFPATPDVAAQLIHHALRDEGRVRQWSKRAQTFAREFFPAPVVARKFVELYREVIGPLRADAASTTDWNSTSPGRL